MQSSLILSTAPLIERDARYLWPDIVRRLPDEVSAQALRNLEWMFLLGFACAARESLGAITASAPVVKGLVTQAQLRADILGTIERKGLMPADDPNARLTRWRESAKRAQAALERRREQRAAMRARRKRAAASKARAARKAAGKVRK
jgi:hypothetical protein